MFFRKARYRECITYFAATKALKREQPARKPFLSTAFVMDKVVNALPSQCNFCQHLRLAFFCPSLFPCFQNGLACRDNLRGYFMLRKPTLVLTTLASLICHDMASTSDIPAVTAWD